MKTLIHLRFHRGNECQTLDRLEECMENALGSITSSQKVWTKLKEESTLDEVLEL